MGRRGISLLLLTGSLLAAAPGAAQARAKPRCTVPNVKGDTLAVARTRLSAAHCAVGTVRKPAGSGAAIVASQSPRAGLTERSGDRVKLTMELKPTVLSTTTTNPVTTTPVATTPALIPTAPLATATIETQNSSGTYYLLGAGLYDNPTGAGPVAIVGEPVTFSIIDGTTGQTVATFSGTSSGSNGSSDCTIMASLNTPTDTAVTFTAEAVAPYAPCALGSAVSVPVTDTPLLGVSFAGNSAYAASVSAQSTDAPL